MRVPFGIINSLMILLAFIELAPPGQLPHPFVDFLLSSEIFYMISFILWPLSEM